jgi:glycolate oxidase FAD binding subunit
MAEALKPRDAKDVEAAVQWALADGKALDIIGSGSKRTIGRPAQTDITLDLSGLSGVIAYEPEELVLTAQAGTPLREIERLVAGKEQMLAFEPIDYGPILGRAGNGTLGGALAANLSGPRRPKGGAARDHFLGFTAISGRGETFKSGGRVVKNVTGYDLAKLIAGSWGTLALMTEVTIKVLPRPETEATVLALGLADAAAIRAMTVAIASACEVSGAAHLPAAIAARIPQAAAVADGRAVTALRIEGVGPSVAHRKATLKAAMKGFGDIGAIDHHVSRRLWQAVRDATPFAATLASAEGPLWRISTTPTKGAVLGAQITGAVPRAEVMYDWAGGLLWVALPGSDDAGEAIVRGAVKGHGGHATLIRAPAFVRAKVAVFTPQDPPLAALTQRVKEGFDPNQVLNPGRMWAGV